MSRSSVEQDPETGLWHWYDETWSRSQTGYHSRRQASRVQKVYADRVLEARNWHPNLGDYVWFREWPDHEQQLAQVVGEALATNFDYYIELLEDGRREAVVYTHQLEPIPAMEVLALVAARPDALF